MLPRTAALWSDRSRHCDGPLQRPRLQFVSEGLICKTLSAARCFTVHTGVVTGLILDCARGLAAQV